MQHAEHRGQFGEPRRDEEVRSSNEAEAWGGLALVVAAFTDPDIAVLWNDIQSKLSTVAEAVAAQLADADVLAEGRSCANRWIAVPNPAKPLPMIATRVRFGVIARSREAKQDPSRAAGRAGRSTAA